MYSCTNFRVVLQILGTKHGNMGLNSTYELWNLSPKIITLAKTLKTGGKDSTILIYAGETHPKKEGIK